MPPGDAPVRKGLGNLPPGNLSYRSFRALHLDFTGTKRGTPDRPAWYGRLRAHCRPRRSLVTIRDSPVLLVTSGRVCSVGRLLGEGGEGQVYEAGLPGDPARYALKWYYPEQASDARRRALTNPRRHRCRPTTGSSGPSSWPTSPGSPAFGYLMPLRPTRFHGLGRLPDPAGRRRVPRAGHRRPAAGRQLPPAARRRASATATSASATSSSTRDRRRPHLRQRQRRHRRRAAPRSWARPYFMAPRSSGGRRCPRPTPTGSRWPCCSSTCSCSTTRSWARRRPTSRC